MDTELNIRVATEVMGYTMNAIPFRLWRVLPDGYNDTLFELPDYSGTWGGMELVCDHLMTRGVDIVLVYTPVYVSCRMWHQATDSLGHGFNPSLPESVCHAALDICAKLRASPSAK
jgi:hypothetical protein